MSIALIGDIALSGLISEDKKNNANRYKKVQKQLENMFVIANLETPIVSKERNEYKTHYLYSDEETTEEILKMLNIKIVSLANNHIFDCKISGVKNTIKLLEKNNIKYTGAGWLPEHIKPVEFNVNGQRAAFVSYVHCSTNPKTENFSELLINYFDIEKVEEEVTYLKTLFDYVICSIHWGKDYSFYPTKIQRIYSKRIIDAGANIIMGHHTHTIQPVEYYKSGTILYSLGGLTFGDFIWDNELRALKKKTKKSIIPYFYSLKDKPKFINTCELKGNFIKIIQRDFENWSKRKLKTTRLIHKYKILEFVINFYEDKIYRIQEWLFGYYRNPITEIFKAKTYKKIKKLF